MYVNSEPIVVFRSFFLINPCGVKPYQRLTYALLQLIPTVQVERGMGAFTGIFVLLFL
ncbi:hypothetical protein Celal_3927 [Cellulophaga algicola DSM 14237]|uniref:Uncharacterized protein n=1 Tax=Cellulophaga algicola (strain DSM 14237 / IC166 / ACAM 630) TaxID=688270 RepID=E6XCB8_CELAD|nr:hypothetical protein Celal_3927 [Cellulophaga algicola DSM 14237]